MEPTATRVVAARTELLRRLDEIMGPTLLGRIRSYLIRACCRAEVGT
jgi:hypothetical protein